MISTNWPDLRQMHTIIFDFDGVFTDNRVLVHDDGREAVFCNRADGLAIDLLRRFQGRYAPDLRFFIVSTERNPVVTARARKLQMECQQSVVDKLTLVREYFERERPDDADPFTGTIYLGNDLNDLPVMERVGFSIAPSDSHPLVVQSASVVLEQKGGDGFVRAAVERLLQLNSLSSEELYALVSDC